jgi:hypothetical protein
MDSSASPQAFAGALVPFVLRTVELGSVVLSWFFFVLSTWPLAILFVVSLLFTISFVPYAPTAIANLEYVMRCSVYPYYQTWPVMVVTFVQTVFNPVICWYQRLPFL